MCTPNASNDILSSDLYESFFSINACDDTKRLLPNMPTKNTECARQYLYNHLKSAIFYLAEITEDNLNNSFKESNIICEWVKILYHLGRIWQFTSVINLRGQVRLSECANMNKEKYFWKCWEESTGKKRFH